MWKNIHENISNEWWWEIYKWSIVDLRNFISRISYEYNEYNLIICGIYLIACINKFNHVLWKRHENFPNGKTGKKERFHG